MDENFSIDGVKELVLMEYERLRKQYEKLEPIKNAKTKKSNGKETVDHTIYTGTGGKLYYWYLQYKGKQT